MTPQWYINILKPRHNGRHFPDDIFKCIFVNENISISLLILLKFVPNVRINNIPALKQIMAWRLPDDKPLSEPMMVILLTHICVTRPQWVNWQRVIKWYIIALMYMPLSHYNYVLLSMPTIINMEIFFLPNVRHDYETPTTPVNEQNVLICWEGIRLSTEGWWMMVNI